MTTLREAAQQALEAIDRALPHAPHCGEFDALADMAEALRAALAEPIEPVAWRWGYRSVTTGEMDWRGYVEIPLHPKLRSPEIIMEPLYTAPPRKPLAEPVPEPYAWMAVGGSIWRHKTSEDDVPLYTTPQYFKP